ncbi:uncharacterized protein LOC62_03G004557 [Vanrija pseudolonga]|uniref:FAS1 domain-containing protein n=1 Tax=Vanrija pseudolonga TaxID=143232 RepID=A0AAF1BLL5_9TREE|nr:hypothetical protein LOC62_03G004557 [Vanrija pseudolonga]
MKATLVLAAAAATLATGANAVLSILAPNSATVWYANNTVPLNWTSAPTDTFPFRAFLSNSNGLLPNAQQLANELTASQDYARVLLPQLSFGDGFIVTFVNTTNTSQIYATSEKFKIESGIPATSTNLASLATTAASQPVIPNFTPTQAAASSANPFASASASGKPSSGVALGPSAQVAGVVAALSVAAAALL